MNILGLHSNLDGCESILASKSLWKTNLDHSINFYDLFVRVISFCKNSYTHIHTHMLFITQLLNILVLLWEHLRDVLWEIFLFWMLLLLLLNFPYISTWLELMYVSFTVNLGFFIHQDCFDFTFIIFDCYCCCQSS